MAKFQFEVEPEEHETSRERVEAWLHLGTRGIGVLLLLFGVWLIAAVVVETWGLFQNPDHIAKFATAIERGSNLDRVLAPRLTEDPELAEPGMEPAPPFRLAYFAAWVIALLLLLVLGQLAIAAIHVGGSLASSDVAIKRLLKELIREQRRTNQGP